MPLSDPSPASRAAVEAAVGALDLAEIAVARWFGAKGPAIASIALEEAFVLDDRRGHVLAIVAVTTSDRGRQRYSMALTGDPLRGAAPGDGAWRALGVGVGEGRAIPSLPAD